MSSGFIGRVPQLAAIADAIGRLAEGRGTLILLAGEAGVGKSRLAAEGAQLAAAAGLRVAWGRCRETAGAAPFWPWLQVLRGLPLELGADAGLVAHVLPEVGQLDGRGDPYLVYDAIARVLGRIAPLVIVLDDLHRADAASLHVLRFVAGELEARPLLVIATYRDAEASDAIAELVGDIVTSGAVRAIELGGLPCDDVAALMAAIGGGPVERAVAQRVWERTAGNPFFVTELAQLGTDVHDVARTVATFHTPHYDVVPLGAQTEGGAAVSELLAMLFAAFPDFDFAPQQWHHADAAVLVEGKLTGTHRGAWAGVPASGKGIEVRACCVYRFDEDRLTSESVYFDHATLLAQIGVR